MRKQLMLTNRLPTQVKPLVSWQHIEPKPRSGGLWTSTLIYPKYSAWTTFCKTDMPEWLIAKGHPVAKPVQRYILTPARTAHIYTINSEKDWSRLCLDPALAHTDQTGPDWELLAQQYDAVHAKGYIPPTWDCESTIWFRYVFKEVREIK